MSRLPLVRHLIPHSIRTRLTAAVSLLVAVIALFLYLYVPYRLHREARVAMDDKAHSIGQMTAYNVSANIVFSDSVGLQDALGIARQNPDLAFITVSDALGRRLASWATPGHPEVRRIPESWNFSADEVLVATTPVLSNGRPVGSVELGLSMEQVHGRIDAAQRMALLLSLLIIAFGVVGALMISRLITRPLDALSDTVGRIAGGDLSQRAAEASSAEVARLVGGFNVMVDRLAAAQTQLTGFNRELEQRVQERTVDLLATQAQLVSARDLAEAGSRAKSEFLANMSHEIRTPMNGVLGTLELTRDTELTTVQREYLDLAHGSAEALLGIINDILDFSKIEAGMMTVERIDCNLADTIDAVVSSLALRAHTQGLELLVQIAPEVPDWIRADAGRIRQVLTNLLGNAIKFTPSGEVGLAVRGLPGGRLQLTVSDTGIGISPEKQRLIFEAFSQADASTTRQYGGTGLGLTISTKLVALMGGEIWVESEPGAGSQFHFTIDAPAALAPRGREAPEGDPLHGVSVLIVDDNATNRRILQDMVAGWGMRGESVESAAAALQLVEEHRTRGADYQLFLLDVHMPGMDGFELATRLRAMTGGTDQAIMMLTSTTRSGDQARCQELGITAHLLKPVRRAELQHAILKLLHPRAVSSRPAALPAEAGLADVPLRILLAEDNLVNQRVAMGFLLRLGHSVEVVGNGALAVECWSREHFDLILMDVQMPVMGGFDAARRIREQERQRGGHTPIIALTAHAMIGDRETCLAEGMDDYLSKPIQREELGRVLRTIDRRVALSPAPALPGVIDVDDELYGEAGSALLETYAGWMERTRTALQSRDWQELKAAAHDWKGAVGYFGATAAFELARQLEVSAADEDPDSADVVFGMLEAALRRLRGKLQQQLAASAG